MGTYIELDEESSSLLDKFCNERIRPTLPGPFLSRIIRPWYARAAKEWIKDKSLIPELESIEGKHTHAIAINKDHATMFRDVLKIVNERCGTNIGEVELISWLTRIFIKMYRIKEKTEGYTMKYGHVARV